VNLIRKFFAVWARQGLAAALRKTFLFIRWKLVKRAYGKKNPIASKKFEETNILLELICSTPTESDDQVLIQGFRQGLTPVIHIVENFDAGGLEQFVLDLAWGQTMTGQRVVIGFTHSGGQMEKQAIARGIEVYNFANFDALRDFIKFQRAATCFLHHSYGLLNAELLDLIDVIEVVHNPYWWQAGNTELMNFRKNMKNLVCVSEYVARFTTEMLQVNRDTMKIIPNCIPIDIVNSRVVSDRRIFLNVANFAEQKNHLLLIKSFIQFCSDLDDYENELWLVGKGILANLSSHIEEMLAENRRVKIRAFHVANHEDMKQIYRDSSFYIQPSTFEGFSLASLEALSYGLPIAISRCGGVHEFTKLGMRPVLIAGITPSNRLLKHDYISATCWDPSEEQISLTASAFKELLHSTPVEIDIMRHFRHEDMVRKYQSLVAYK
jgi:glycosyltransferase involved in cell wall biosynthesis